jgi:hypothetical protein
MIIVQRVHWLRARAQSGRWNEEVILVTYEMQWTVRYFLHQAQRWDHLAASEDEGGRSACGPAAYARRKAAMWRWLALKGRKRFIEVQPSVHLEEL